VRIFAFTDLSFTVPQPETVTLLEANGMSLS
jgi:hypothetical protein